MGSLFGAFQDVEAENKQKNFENVAAYEAHYMRLLKKYSPEIQMIEEMMENLRRERKNFYQKDLPEIKLSMEEDNILSDDNKAEWLSQLQENMEHSFQISESLIQHYITKNLEEFKKALKDEMNRV